MNNRIKELEKQCWNHQTNHLDTEKFAKLIVQECAQVCKQEWYDLNNRTPIPNDTPRNIGFRVGQKAGVITCINSVINTLS
jgi:hypothetical protein